MFKRLTRLPLLIMSLILVLTVSTVAAHETTSDINNPPALEKTTDGTTAYGGKHVVWEHAHLDQPWHDRGWGDRWLPQSIEVDVGDVLNWSDLNYLDRTIGCRTTHWRSYSTTAIYGASNGLVAENAYGERNNSESEALSGDWGLNYLDRTIGCRTTHWRSYSTTAIYGASNGLVAENAYERNNSESEALSGDWGLGGEFTHVGTVYVYRVTMGFTGNSSGNGTFNCLMWEKYQFRVSE